MAAAQLLLASLLILRKPNIGTRPRLLMNFTLRYVRIYPGVNSRAEFVTLALGYLGKGASYR